MKQLRQFSLLAALLVSAAACSQGFEPKYDEPVVYEGSDVIFRQIDEHTWEGNGHLMFFESLYLIEGNDRALLLDAGTEIADLDKIVAGITSKPVTLIATHVHPDHTGSAINYWSEIYLNAADTPNIPQFMPNYKGEIHYLYDGQVFDLGGREIEIIFTPGHTPGSTTFMDRAAHYGFSADAFGSGNLLLTTNFSTLLLTCQRVKEYMERYGITKLYPGHYNGQNPETLQRVSDMLQMSRDILDGRVEGEKSPQPSLGLDHVLVQHGVRINYGEAQLK